MLSSGPRGTSEGDPQFASRLGWTDEENKENSGPEIVVIGQKRTRVEEMRTRCNGGLASAHQSGH